MTTDRTVPGAVTCVVTAVGFLLALALLAVRLAEVQIDYASEYSEALQRQASRRVRTDGCRGRILARGGEVLAGNRRAPSIALNAERFQRRTWEETAAEIRRAVESAAVTLGLDATLTDEEIRLHLRRRLARPLIVWRDVGARELARFFERSDELEGFSCVDETERVYPYGPLAAHLIGYVGRDRVEAGEERADFYDLEPVGRSGLELYYNGFLRGSTGESILTVDARGYVCEERTVVEAKPGPDLAVTIDVAVQAELERQLRGHRGAGVVLDADSGEVLAMASAPGYDLRRFVPTLPRETYAAYRDDPALPLFDRAARGLYAPGSTFKPLVALAGLSAGLDPRAEYDCQGAYRMGEMRIRCARTWGHGPLNLAEALRDSCNAYFCNFGVLAGSNAVIRTARAFGLGAPTGIDFTDAAGLVPDAEAKRRRYSAAWYAGDLAHTSIGQGMLLVTPLQMARVVAALGTGRLVVPHLKLGLEPVRTPLPFPADHLAAVTNGMRLVVGATGTGSRGAAGVDAFVIGKTGTAEVGSGTRRRKNTWFVAYAHELPPAGAGDAWRPSVRRAVALVIEDGESGGGTAAPPVAEVLKSIYNRAPRGEGADDAS